MHRYYFPFPSRQNKYNFNYWWKGCLKYIRNDALIFPRHNEYSIAPVCDSVYHVYTIFFIVKHNSSIKETGCDIIFVVASRECFFVRVYYTQNCLLACKCLYMELITSVKYAPTTWNTIYRGKGNLNLRSLPLLYRRRKVCWFVLLTIKVLWAVWEHFISWNCVKCK